VVPYKVWCHINKNLKVSELSWRLNVPYIDRSLLKCTSSYKVVPKQKKKGLGETNPSAKYLISLLYICDLFLLFIVSGETNNPTFLKPLEIAKSYISSD